MNAGSRMEKAQVAGFIVAGEPLAVDLADTIITTTDPATDLLSDEATCRLWWSLERDRMPERATTPTLALTVELRRAVRDLLDAHVAGTAPDPAAVEYVNDVAAGVTATRRLEHTRAGWTAVTTHHVPANRRHELALGAVTDSLMDLLAGPANKRLRRCQNPSCSMLFVATDARRKFCTQNICANRTRVARHYHRHRPG
ncbi:ABATE domain-containing protein [Mycobacterium sp. CVI_P3]|uniref:ABATE domain-containing protein n=1 Tax=Mycobacterium pinniadriaticum TaxID=2994102 RepID=A0ABT3SHH0_9MYCO|nr:ABATE domain-containing protein [Mycobacterium pinniadriaticum]MCX2932423.1 ABATE domain-containing protein [Mycobacterium pinniadriaticum]MCX2938943.1 ABATE domain-containing protein [Mycobacterium pinniadriaticum]